MTDKNTEIEFQMSYSFEDEAGNRLDVSVPTDSFIPGGKIMKQANGATLTCSDGREIELNKENLDLQVANLIHGHVFKDTQKPDTLDEIKRSLKIAKVSDPSDAVIVETNTGSMSSHHNLMEKTCKGDIPLL